jgi:methyl-accepting chemotaxis protein
MIDFSKISIRLILGLVIGILGALLIFASASGVWDARQHYAQSSRVAALTAASQPLFKSLLGARIERGTFVAALSADPPISPQGEARVLENRGIAETNYKDAVGRLSEIETPGLANILATLRHTHDAYYAAQQALDAALHQPKPGRDSHVLQETPQLSQAWVNATIATIDFVDSATKMTDPVVDQLLSVKRVAWAMRSAAGLAAVRVETASATGQPWGLPDIIGFNKDFGRVTLAWDQLVEAAARPDAPKLLVDAVNEARLQYIGFVNGDLKTYVDALSTGHKLDVPTIELQTRDTKTLGPVVDVVTGALAAMIARANTQAASARQSFLLNGAGLMGALIFTAIGILIVFRRVSAPIRAMTSAMRRLAGRDIMVVVPGVGRGDEIGEMASAVAVFRDEMVRAAELDKQAKAQLAMEAAREAELAAEREALAARQAEVVDSLAQGLARLASGDLTNTIRNAFAPEYDRLRIDFNNAVSALQSAMRDVITRSRAISTGTHEIASAADDLARRTEQQAAGLEETAAALDEVTATVRQTAEGTNRAQTVAASAKMEVENSSKIITETVAAMGSIEGSARQIGQIIGVIDEIAFQTNLLALNAGVEAARAGEAGRGFAVVAQEVRALAQRAADAAKEIKTLVINSMQQVERGVRLVDETGAALARIHSGVSEMNAAIRDIAASAAEQATGLAEVNIAVNEMDQTTQQNAAMVEQSTAATHSLAHETEALKHAIEQFNIEPSGGGQTAQRQRKFA